MAVTIIAATINYFNELPLVRDSDKIRIIIQTSVLFSGTIPSYFYHHTGSTPINQPQVTLKSCVLRPTRPPAPTHTQMR